MGCPMPRHRYPKVRLAPVLNDEQHQMVIDCCRELVQAESYAGREAAAAAVAERWMRALGYDEVYVGTYGSVTGRIHGRAGVGTRLHYDGHLDTVPATARSLWRRDPFGAELADGAIWGRGTVDMKGPVAAMICAAAFVSRADLHGTLTVSASVAEEAYEGEALAAILSEHPVDLVVIGEATALQVGVGHKGRAGICVTTLGTPAHSSTPHMGDNAVYTMMEVIRVLRELPPHHDPVLGASVLELVEIVSAPYPGTGMVPDLCTTRWDRRLVRGETQAHVLAEIQAALAPFGDRVQVNVPEVQVAAYTGATLRGPDFHAAWAIAAEHPFLQAALASVQAVGLPAQTCAPAYCTNGSATAGRLGIPTLVLGPGDPTQLHRIDEHLSIEQLLLGTQVYMELTRRVLSGAV